MKARSVTDCAPLTLPAFEILLSLVDGSMHGYAMIQDIVVRTDGAVRLTPSTLYGAIKRMLDDGLIEEVPHRRGTANAFLRRRSYRITRNGLLAARAEAQRLERLISSARAKQLLPPLRIRHAAHPT